MSSSGTKDVSRPLLPHYVNALAWISDHHAVLLAESPLATDQRIAPSKRPEGGHELCATVTDSSLLTWWVRSQGVFVKVLAPADLASRI